MQFKKLAAGLAIVAGLAAIGASTTTANASYLNGNDYAREATRSVKVTKTVKLLRVHTGSCEANQRVYRAGTLKKGSRVSISTNLMSTGGWVVRSKKIHANRRNFYLVAGGNKHWYTKVITRHSRAHVITLKKQAEPMLGSAPKGQWK